ncbi:ParA family protein [Dolichospermum sp. ST_con]|nr:ParA family protein [Dolichospermum sp. ST_con]MDD1420786.1 ParA family protein [Dolichospermum sp. ST_sed1]MDD1425840.1 ParA family protein [Dolichospermum sp. ST_sed9]MDD1432774.1 ParA family protein [Dolichospermum sp. ST_sed6]MDD1437182.1 ParA family protein [Dolichospermum sp. ST_sed10]MDD1441501.1 ParA family protein [Dolichospermum sp. ST_sed3]MDD1447488.1 ParA family protein [Dolichospermum sp. ST_sed8]MDD1455341.1 ParA family protein [Dolichospermum sp. ST_sed7]MDD1461638.1 ParA
MNGLKLFTWLDVRRIIRQKTNYGTNLPEGILKIRCYSDSLDIYIATEEDQGKVINHLKEWFKDWYQAEESVVCFDIGDATLPVGFITGEEPYITDIEIRPFWEEIAYLESESETETTIKKVVKLPEAYSEKCGLIAFYSFKGGVGRTLNLAAHLFALLDRAKELDHDIKVLVIDADLEAPGLTYWNASEKQQPEVSFINFLEVYHYSPIEREEALSFFAREVKKSAKNDSKSTIYFLPAFLKDEQLLDTPILPEHLVRGIDGVWEYGNALYDLGEVLDVDYIFIDLRAGLSEISSPIIFDPRIQRFLVTTINDQSIKGTSLVLKQIGKVAPSGADVKNKTYYDPAIIISMLKQEFKKLPNFDDATLKLRSAYVQPQEDNLLSDIEARLNIKETYFAENLLYVNNWEDARSELNVTSVVMGIAKEWAEGELSPTSVEEIILNPIKDRLEEVIRLRNLSQRYEYAENGEGEDLLVTEPLKNLASNYKEQLPCVVSIGAKGAGKTFNYVQLSRFKYWESFLEKIDNRSTSSELKTYIFPLLQTGNLLDKAKKVTNEARNNVREALSENVPEFSPDGFKTKIQKALSNVNWAEPEWTEFWINEISIATGINNENENVNDISIINRELKKKNLRIIFLFDGLENIFPEISSQPQQEKALRALIQNVPGQLAEIRQSNIGLIIFLRRDFLRYTIKQDLKQFENLYRPYDLSWDQDSFLRLVYWICSKANVIRANKDIIDSLSKKNITEELQNLWGKKLGADNSNEAYTDSWIFAALTDFNNRLQARDVVRLLYHAADITVENSHDSQLVKWFASRLLPPQAIRRAIEPCSRKKVDEAKEEYPTFKIWVDENLYKFTPEQKKIPFAVEELGMDQQTVRMLEEMGVIYEDTGKQDTARFYMPEIFREGLGFSLARGARPRVMVLKRKALGKGIL